MSDEAPPACEAELLALADRCDAEALAGALRRAAALDLATLHRIRQRYHRSRRVAPVVSGDAAAWAAELDRSGIVELRGFVAPASLERLRDDFASFVAALSRRLESGEGVYRRYDEEEHWWPRDRCFITNNAFRHSAELVRLCRDAEWLAAVDAYVGKPAYIQRGLGMRYLPCETNEREMFGWHHDMEDRRVKAMVLLTDVGADDQPMSYVAGSHRLFHPLSMFYENACPLEYCRRHLGEIEIVYATGRAGDVFLFDSNGAHRGNRRPDGAVRDAFFVELSADLGECWGCDLPPGLAEELSARGLGPFRRIVAAEKKWQERRATPRIDPTWIETLPQLGAWLGRLD